MKHISRFAAAAALSLLLGCAANPGAEGRAPRSQGNRITAEEIAQTQVQTTFELIRALRPAWLESRGPQSLTNPNAGRVVVYVDGTRMGSVETLAQIPAANLASAQYMTATEAGARFGLDHTGGAILLTTRR